MKKILLVILMAFITNMSLVAKEPSQGFINGTLQKLSFPNGQTKYYSGKGAFKSIMMAKVYFYTNSNGQKKLKYMPIATTPIVGYLLEDYKFKLETGLIFNFGSTWGNIVINTGFNNIELEEVSKEEYNVLVQNFNNMAPNNNYRGNSFGNGSGGSRSSSRTCPSCGGSGRCNGCAGKGQYWEEVGYYTGTSHQKKINCPVCKGSGRCGTCYGKGSL